MDDKRSYFSYYLSTVALFFSCLTTAKCHSYDKLFGKDETIVTYKKINSKFKTNNYTENTDLKAVSRGTNV